MMSNNSMTRSNNSSSSKPGGNNILKIVLIIFAILIILYCIFSLIKLFCILKGIENRINQGNAFSNDAELKAKAAPAIKDVLMNAFEVNPKDIIIS